MSKSRINFDIELDAENIPEKITWGATQEKLEGQETKAISLSLWDADQANTMRIDLWTKEMPVDQMKRFIIDCLGGLSQTVLNSTGDEFMSTEINQLCDKLVDHIKKESNS